MAAYPLPNRELVADWPVRQVRHLDSDAANADRHLAQLQQVEDEIALDRRIEIEVELEAVGPLEIRLVLD
jgi:hypothetical protein